MANGNDWDANLSRPWVNFTFNGPSAPVLDASVEYSMDAISARASFNFPVPPAIEINQQVQCFGGYRAGDRATSNYLLFAGWIEDDDLKYLDLTNTLAIGDRLRLTQQPIGDAFYDESPFDYVAVYDSTGGLYDNSPPGGWTDTLIARDLLFRAGIVSPFGATNFTNEPLLAGVGGRDIALATRQAIVLKNTETPADLLKKIDGVTGCATFSTPSGVKRIATTFTPAPTAAWNLIEGLTLLDVQVKRSLRAFHNKIIVKGLRIGGAQFISVRRGPPNLPPAPGNRPGQLPYGRAQDLVYKLSQDLIQSQEHADLLSGTLYATHNRVERRFTCTTGFNPQAEPGQTVLFQSPTAKVPDPILAWAYGVKHSLNDSGAWTTWDLAVIDGDAGTLVGSPPTLAILPAVFSGPITDVNGDELWTVTLDGSLSSDPDNPPDAPQAGLIFAWTDTLGGTGDAPAYSLVLTTAQLDAHPSVTLTLTDPQANTSTATVVLTLP